MTELIVGNAALLVIDMQHDFLDEEVGCSALGGQDIIPRVGSVVAAAKEVALPVIFTRELHREDGIDGGRENDAGVGSSYAGGEEGVVPAHCVEGTRGAEIADGVGYSKNDLRVDKRRYSCFLGTDLQFVLNAFDISTLLVAGVVSNCCVLWTVGDGFQRDYHVRVIEDCVAGSSLEEHEAALLIMRALTVGRPVHADEVIRAFSRRGSRV